MRIVEIFGSYSSNHWKRWWFNTHTGQIVAVDPSNDHDAQLMDNLDVFLDRHVIDMLTADDEGEIDTYEHLDDFLTAAYEAGWIAVLYDGNQQEVNLRATGDALALKQIAKLVRTIEDKDVVSTLQLDIENGEHVEHVTLTGSDLKQFKKSGHLINRRV